MDKGDAVGMPFPPPPVSVFLFGLGGWLIETQVPTTFATQPLAAWIGWAALLSGVALVALAFVSLRRVGAKPDPRVPVPAMAEQGVYAFSRNPMYAGMVLALAGAGLALDSIWITAAAAVALWFLQRSIIAREEAYLGARFPAEYARYRARVRRWL
jgi:protein-S-isoprenylcysteine O-methyltransferase Ste14